MQGFGPWRGKGLQTVVTLDINTFSLLWIQDLDNLIQDMDSDENKVSKSRAEELLQQELNSPVLVCRLCALFRRLLSHPHSSQRFEGRFLDCRNHSELLESVVFMTVEL